MGMLATRRRSRRSLFGAGTRLLPYPLARSEATLGHRLFDHPMWVAPASITAKPGPEGTWEEVRDRDIALMRRMRARLVIDGGWDLETRATFIPLSIEELFVQGLAPRATAAHRRMAEAMVNGDQVRSRGRTSLADIDAYFEGVVQLHDAMARDGFRSQRELGQSPFGGALVCIGRSGQLLLLRNGNHRTAIAMLLGLSTMPVYVCGIHVEWVERCNRRYGTTNVVKAVERGITEIVDERRDVPVLAP